MSLPDRKTPEPAGSAMPLWLGLAAAVVLLATSLAGSQLPASTMTAAATATATAPAGAAAMQPAADAPAPAKTAAPAMAATTAPAATATVAMTAATVTPAAATTPAAMKTVPAATPAAASLPTPDVPLDQLMAPGPLPEMVLGDANAPVTVVEYASMTCPHCADFHKRVFPDFKTKFIDTGKARLIFREFPLDNLAAAVSELARCLGPVRYFAFVGTMFDRQAEWHTGDNDLPKLQDISKQAGFTDDSFKKCVTDQKMLDAIKETRKIADEKFHVDSTPTFFVNGVKLKEGHEIADFDKAMAPYLKG